MANNKKQYCPWFSQGGVLYNPRTGYSVQPFGDGGLYTITDKRGFHVLPEANPMNFMGGLRGVANRDHVMNVQGS